MRVGVAADMATRFEHGDLVMRVQPPGGDHARDAGADDGDAHDTSERKKPVLRYGSTGFSDACPVGGLRAGLLR